MAVVEELIRSQSDVTLSFGNYKLAEKAKRSDFVFHEDVYKIKTYFEITRLEKNELFAYESVPGTAVSDYRQEDDGLFFRVEGAKDAQITVGLEPETEYIVLINGSSTGSMKTNLGGKLSFGIELENASEMVEVRIRKA